MGLGSKTEDQRPKTEGEVKPEVGGQRSEVKDQKPDVSVAGSVNPTSDPASPLPAASREPLDLPGSGKIECVRLTIPLADPPDTQVHRVNAWHVDCQFRENETRLAFRQIQEGLYRSQARLADGRPVVSGADVIRWLVQQVSFAKSSES